MDLAAELAQYGPDAPQRGSISVAQAEAYCWKLATSHYENFSVVSWLAPRRLRTPLAAIYGYCRWADDLADETGSTQESLRLLEWWEKQTLALDDARAVHTHPVFVLLHAMRKCFSIPTSSLLDLLKAFRQDQHKRRYATRAELLEYCRNSASPVGRLVLGLVNGDDAISVQLSDEICTGLQLANFAQDVARDFAKGRIYLPQGECYGVGLCEEDFVLASKTPGDKRERWQALLESQVKKARDHFDAGSPLLHRVPTEIRPAIGLFLAGGREILTAIEQQQFDVWVKRPKLSKWTKGKLLAQVAWQTVWGK